MAEFRLRRDDPVITLQPFRYQGGKASMADWVLDRLPKAGTLIDLCGGSGVITFTACARRAFDKFVFNDLNEEVVDFFRTLRDEPDRLMQSIALTPCARVEFLRANAEPDHPDPVERARRFFVRACQAFRGAGQDYSSTWDTRRNGSQATECLRRDVRLAAIARMLRTIAIERSDAAKCVRLYDRPEALFYADPPYLHDTRRRKNSHYKHDMNETEHIELADLLNSAQGNAAVSGYPSDLYDRLYSGWTKYEKSHRCYTAASVKEISARTEVLWVKRHTARNGLFDG